MRDENVIPADNACAVPFAPFGYATRGRRREHVRSISGNKQKQIKTGRQIASQFCISDCLQGVNRTRSGHGVVVGIGVVISAHPNPS